jgi:hypothetical protein
MMTLRPTYWVSAMNRHETLRKRTFGPESDLDCVGEDVDTLEDARTAVVAELDVLVCVAREHRGGGGLGGLRSSATEGAGRGIGETVHGVGREQALALISTFFRHRKL